MNSIWLVPVYLVLGWLIQKGTGRYSAQITAYLTKFVIYLALPALVLAVIPAIEFQQAYLLPIAMPWVQFAMAAGLFSFLGKKLGWSRTTTGCIILCAGLGNTSFIGIPVMNAIWGEAGVEIALLADQPGSFACLSTAGILLAAIYSGQRISAGSLAKKMLSFPPFVAFTVAFLLNLLHTPLSGNLLELLNFLGSLVVPVALLAVGSQLSSVAFKEFSAPLIWGLTFKLLLSPLVFLIAYVVILEEDSLLAEGSVMEAAMGPMVTAALVAHSYGLNSKLAYQHLTQGILLSFLTLSGWYYVLSYLT
jgi:predicted permease